MDSQKPHWNAAFREEQRFTQKFLWVPVILSTAGAVAIFTYGMYVQLIEGKPFGTRPLSDTALMIVGTAVILLLAAVSWLLFTMSLVTEVRGDGIHLHFRPLFRKFIPFKDVKSCHAREYRPIREYGGWGVRWGPSGKAYNVSGNLGVQLELSNGNRLLIGSQRPNELASAILSRLR